MTFGSCEQNQRKFDQVFEVPFCPPIYQLVMVLGLLGWWLSYRLVLHFGDSLGPFDKKSNKKPIRESEPPTPRLLCFFSIIPVSDTAELRCSLIQKQPFLLQSRFISETALTFRFWTSFRECCYSSSKVLE